jgi:hypothetical protein
LIFSGVYPLVRFPSEKINIHVYPDHIIVEGYYTYKNNWPFPVNQGFTVPFPVDENHPMPVYISVEQIYPSYREIPFSIIMGKYSFEKYFPAGEEITVKVRYYQYASVKNAEYILITTQAWGKQLDNGIYQIFPENTVITNSNYRLKLRKGILLFERNQFMPVENWRFSWK